MSEHSLLMFDAKHNQLIGQGKWNLANALQLKKEMTSIKLKGGDVIFDGQAISKLDSGVARIFHQWLVNLASHGIQVQLQNFSDQHKTLLSFAESNSSSDKNLPKKEHLGSIQELGKFSLGQFNELYEYINFTGELALEGLRVLVNPTLWRLNSIISVINKTGTEALPIIALLSFMIGVVISYQMGNQLRNYGANIFIVNLLGLSVLREFGPLLTAIMVAGRTGSAFTAQLGFMKINQEIDAINMMGITPAELLILPRLAGLFLVIPLLTIWADIFGIVGGMMMAKNMLDIGWYDFLLRFRQEIPLKALIIGLGKAPVFALIIASISCFQGMSVSGSAASVGTRTTRSVVLSIFFIIIVDAIFSVIFSELKL